MHVQRKDVVSRGLLNVEAMCLEPCDVLASLEDEEGVSLVVQVLEFPSSVLCPIMLHK